MMELEMSTKSKRAFEELVGPLLTHDDIARLLVSYYGAVALDQVRADELCSCGKRKRGLCKENRNDHLVHLELLLDTLSGISNETLEKLTVLAATRKPTVVREVLIELLVEGTGAHLVGERMWSAPEFFNALVKEVDQGNRAPKDGEDAVERMMRWLNPADPLTIAQECGYKKGMSAQIWR